MATPEYFGVFARRYLKAGVRLIGGCCGTRPEHITAMAAAARMMGGSATVVSSPRRGAATAIDDVLAACAATFLLCIYLITFALRTRSHKRAALLARIIERLFLATLTVMTVAGFFMVYTVW